MNTETENLVLEHLRAVPGHNVGVIAECRPADGRVALSFGGFPDGKPVQTAVRTAGGTIERFGPLVRRARAAGFHDPVFEEWAEALKLIALAFTENALISNGHNSIWNRVPAADNARARERLRACAGE